MSATKSDIARWMVEEIAARVVLYQDDAAHEISRRFGEEWVRNTDAGNLAIHPGVLAEFRKVKPEHVEWDKSDKSWS